MLDILHDQSVGVAQTNARSGQGRPLRLDANRSVIYSGCDCLIEVGQRHSHMGCCSVGVLRPVELEDEKGAHRHNVQSRHRNVHVHVDSGVLSMNVKRSLVIMPAGPPRLTDRDADVARSQHYVASVS